VVGQSGGGAVKFRTSEMMYFYVYGDVEHCDLKELFLCDSTVRERNFNTLWQTDHLIRNWTIVDHDPFRRRCCFFGGYLRSGSMEMSSAAFCLGPSKGIGLA
jgi:hypothetical protein